MVAQESHLPESFVSQHEQSVSSNYLLRLIMQDYEAPIERSLSSADALFVSQSKVIRKIAKEGSCVIIGRCADFILKDCPSNRLSGSSAIPISRVPTADVSMNIIWTQRRPKRK